MENPAFRDKSGSGGMENPNFEMSEQVKISLKFCKKSQIIRKLLFAKSQGPNHETSLQKTSWEI